MTAGAAASTIGLWMQSHSKIDFPGPQLTILDELGKASWFSNDWRSIPKTAFRTHQGHYEYRVMPFGASAMHRPRFRRRWSICSNRFSTVSLRFSSTIPPSSIVHHSQHIANIWKPFSIPSLMGNSTYVAQSVSLLRIAYLTLAT